MSFVFALECKELEYFSGINQSVTPEDVLKDSVYDLMMRLKGNRYAKLPVCSMGEKYTTEVGLVAIKFAFLEWSKATNQYDLFFDGEAMVVDKNPNFYVCTDISGDQGLVFNGGYLRQAVDGQQLVSFLSNQSKITA